MRILFVLSRVPYPLEKGDKLRAFHLIRELSARHEVLLFCLADTKTDKRAEGQLKKYCTEVYIHRIPTISKLFNLGKAVFSNKPFQVAYFHSASAQKKFDAFIDAHLPQHIFCQLIRTVEYVKNYRTIPKTLDYMDAFSTGMSRMAGKANWPKKMLMQIEFKRLKYYEQFAAPLFKNHTIISEQDRDCLDVDANIHVLPNGIDPIFFKPAITEKTREILFTGNMSYRPNIESARFLAMEVMPLVWNTMPNVRVTIAGAKPSPQVTALASEKIEVTGWVDDIASVYAGSRLFVAPMLINSGLQNKLLEAMACGIPCITTTLANNALKAIPNEHIFIADDKVTFAQRIIDALANTDHAQAVALKGQSYVLENYSWQREANRLEALIQLGA